jgi:biopolymer transport protein TolR
MEVTKSGRQRGRRKKLMAEMNVVPYIDVMLVLLIIFMATAPLVTQGVRVELPKAVSEPVESDSEPHVITVNAAGEYFIDWDEDKEKPVDLDTVAAKILAVRSTKPDEPVFIKGDKGVAYGKIVHLLASLSAAGVTGVGLLTEPEG